MTFRFVVASLILIGPAFALSPLEGDCVLFDGRVEARDGIGQALASLEPGRRPVGFYLSVEGIEEFTVALNGAPIKEVKPGKTPRTIIRAVDLTDFVNLLRPGNNRLEISAPGGVGEFRLRSWTSDRAWYLSSFHAHTTYSDGALTVHELLQEVLADGGRAYAITDHDTLGQCYDTAFHRVGNLDPVRGYEWTTDSGHANLLGIEGANTIPHGSIHDMIDEGSWRGALVQINHPYDLENMSWARCPLLDPGIDLIEVFNSVTWFPPGKGPTDSDAQAVAWWQNLLAGGATIAGVGNSDFHLAAPEIDVLNSCSFVYAPSNEPDTILKYSKLGTVLVWDAPDDSKLWLYADTNNNGSWDLVMGEHARVPSGSKTIRFRLEVEDADWLDEVYVFDRSGEIFSEILWTGGDFDHEWSRTFSPADRDFMRVELCAELGLDYEGVTNPIYVNHRDYERGPSELLTAGVGWPDTLYVGQEDTLRFFVRNTAGYSPYRTGLAVALDTSLFGVAAWQTAGPGVGRVVERSGSGHRIIEWQAGYTWQNRLPVGANFEYWLVVRPKVSGASPVLYRAWADDRLFLVDEDPASGFLGPESKYWYRRLVTVDELVGAAEPAVPECRASSFRAAPNPAPGFVLLDLSLAARDPARRVALYDMAGRGVSTLPLSNLPPGRHIVKWEFRDRAGAAPAPGVYFLCLETASRRRVSRLVLAR